MVYKLVKEGNYLVKAGGFYANIGRILIFIHYNTLSTFFIEFNMLSS